MFYKIAIPERIDETQGKHQQLSFLFRKMTSYDLQLQ